MHHQRDPHDTTRQTRLLLLPGMHAQVQVSERLVSHEALNSVDALLNADHHARRAQRHVEEGGDQLWSSPDSGNGKSIHFVCGEGGLQEAQPPSLPSPIALTQACAAT
jgi:hypothetical protein